ncbi:hypothetical protein DE146DRAFT_277878 [Phaeosphaeria sp. MPI-PUGE-AT-0046c]|nr:hypothetical protein DE146DRAFT_277878 [Phaeosphaeria sp. MPI-PUGE-AT-0046c]
MPDCYLACPVQRIYRQCRPSSLPLSSMMHSRISPMDIFDAVSDAPTGTASRSTPDVLRNKQKSEGIETSISRNIARDNTIQINGHIAERIVNVNVQNLTLRWQCKLTEHHVDRKTRTTAIEGAIRSPTELPNKTFSQAATSAPLMPQCTTISGKPTTTKPATTMYRGQGNLSPMNLSLYSKSSKRPHIVCAIFRAGIRHNFIAGRIVRRLCLEKSICPMSMKSLVWGRDRLTSTGETVDCACFVNGSDVIYRFHIVENREFDVLFDADTLSAQSTAPSGACLDR